MTKCKKLKVMAQKSITEFDAKRIIQKNWLKYFKNLKLQSQFAKVNSSDIKFPDWVNNRRLVAKPDMCFGKRSKNNLVLLNKNSKEVKDWIKEVSSSNTKVYSKFDIQNKPVGNYKEGILTNFLIEEFVPHAQSEEFYLSIQTKSDHDVINFSTKGGINIEENWKESVHTVQIPIFSNLDNLHLEIKSLTDNSLLQNFILGSYQLFKELHFSYLEFNPFILMDSTIILLDTVAKLDDTAQLAMSDVWVDDLRFPMPFGMPIKSDEVKNIEELDQKTGASLKLTILNPKGRVWTLLAGGGASIVAMDSLTENLLDYKEIANYGEYSGNPSQEETFQYTDNFLKLLTKHAEVKNKKLIISGAIANFTDIAKTFKGIIKAINLHKQELLNQNVEVFVRRGGPNYMQGLKDIQEACQKLNIPVSVHGPEVGITEICKQAIS